VPQVCPPKKNKIILKDKIWLGAVLTRFLILTLSSGHFVTKIYSHFQISIKFSFFKISNIPYFKKEKFPNQKTIFKLLVENQFLRRKCLKIN
jgi:hypothetical protein